jgi:hypothetical protein
MLPAHKRRGSPTGGGNFYIFKKATPAAAGGGVQVHQVDHDARARRAVEHRHRLRRGAAGRLRHAGDEEIRRGFPPPRSRATSSSSRWRSFRRTRTSASPRRSTTACRRRSPAPRRPEQAMKDAQREAERILKRIVQEADARPCAGRSNACASRGRPRVTHDLPPHRHAGCSCCCPRWRCSRCSRTGRRSRRCRQLLLDAAPAPPGALRRPRQLPQHHRRPGVLAARSGTTCWFALGTIPVSIALALLMALWVNAASRPHASCAWPISRRPCCR